MKNLKTSFVVSLLLLLANFSNAQSHDKQAQWKLLQASAQKIGICLYMTSMPDDQCKCLMNDGDKKYMSVLNRGWARTRIMSWMKRREQPITNGVIIYDRGTTTDSGELENGYIVASVAEITLETRIGTGNKHVFYFKSTSGSSILNNTYWREFMSSREGRTLNSCMWSFNSMENKEVKEFVALFNQWLGLYAK